MAEVIATLATIASLVEAGGKIVAVTTKVVKSIRNATSEVKATHEELKVTVSVLGQFKSSLSKIRGSGDEHELLQDSFLETINKSNDECFQVFAELKFALEGAMPGVFTDDGAQALGHARKRDQFLWPLSKTEVEKLQIRLQKVQEDMRGHAGIIELAITTHRYQEDRKWAREDAKYQYKLIKNQIREAGLRAKHAKLNMARLQTGRTTLPNGLQRRGTTQSIEDGSVISNFVANLDRSHVNPQKDVSRPSPPTVHAANGQQGDIANEPTNPAKASPPIVPVNLPDANTPNGGEQNGRPRNDLGRNGTGAAQPTPLKSSASSSHDSDEPVEAREINLQGSDRLRPISAEIPHRVFGDLSTPNLADLPNTDPQPRPDQVNESIHSELYVSSAVPAKPSGEESKSSTNKDEPEAGSTPKQATTSSTSWWRRWREKSKGRISISIEPGSHCALLLSRGSPEWQACTLRISDEELASVLQVFKERKKMIWQYYNRLAPDQADMIEEACDQVCEQLTTTRSQTWTIVAIELVPKRSRGADIRSIKLVIKWIHDSALPHVQEQDQQQDGPIRFNVNRRTRDWTADQARRRFDRLDVDNDMSKAVLSGLNKGSPHIGASQLRPIVLRAEIPQRQQPGLSKRSVADMQSKAQEKQLEAENPDPLIRKKEKPSTEPYLFSIYPKDQKPPETADAEASNIPIPVLPPIGKKLSDTDGWGDWGKAGKVSKSKPKVDGIPPAPDGIKSSDDHPFVFGQTAGKSSKNKANLDAMPPMLPPPPPMRRNQNLDELWKEFEEAEKRKTSQKKDELDGSPPPQRSRSREKLGKKIFEVPAGYLYDSMLDMKATEGHNLPKAAPAKSAPRQYAYKRPKSKTKTGARSGELEIIRFLPRNETVSQSRQPLPDYWSPSVPSAMYPTPSVPYYPQPTYYPPYGYYQHSFPGTYPPITQLAYPNFRSAEHAQMQPVMRADETDFSSSRRSTERGRDRRSNASRTARFAPVVNIYNNQSDDDEDEDEERDRARKTDESGEDSREDDEGQVNAVDDDNMSRNSDAASQVTFRSHDGSVVGDLIRKRLNITIPSEFEGSDDGGD